MPNNQPPPRDDGSGLPPVIRAAVEHLATLAAKYWAQDPSLPIAGVIHERGTLEWKHLRLMLEQADGRERNDDWVVELLGRDTVLDLYQRGAGPQEAAKFRRQLETAERALPIVVTTNDGRCLSLVVEVPPA
jgi:hypothetical protein